MKLSITNLIIVAGLLLSLAINQSCKRVNNNEKESISEQYSEGSFGYDLQFLKEKDETLMTLYVDSSLVLVSPKYQGKVFTSSSNGKKGKSYGWINYEAFSKQKNLHMNAYGGENRFWLGPEGGKYSIFFKPEDKMIYENWFTPSEIDTESWEVKSKSHGAINMFKSMELTNYEGTEFKLEAERYVEILSKDEILSLLDINTDGLKLVGFTTRNSITNKGENAWTKKTGAPCIWILDMFSPSPETVIIIPYKDNISGTIATTDYFGLIPEDRIKIKNGSILYKADGKSRGKLGVPPKRAKNISGSYDPTSNTLTITRYDLDRDETYLNQEWSDKKDPYEGDAVNAYNDGPLDDGTQMGPFYEIESVSPAAFLAPGQSLTHCHSVFHFTGDKTALNKISNKLLSISLQDISQTFQ